MKNNYIVAAMIGIMVVANIACSTSIAKKVDTTNDRLESLSLSISEINVFQTSTIKEEPAQVIETEYIPEDIASHSETTSERTTVTEIANTYSIPSADTSFKAYMDYRAITNTSSDQYKIQQKAWTDDEGLRRLGEAYIVAMGTYYADKCGKAFEITFDTDETIIVVVGDVKADMHTDSTNRYRSVYDENGQFISANVLEFIVDVNAMPRSARRAGSVESCANLQGNITSIVEIDPGYYGSTKC